MSILLNTIHWLFLIYTWFIIARVLGSWFPSFANSQIMRFIAFYTDPYLNLFRRIIPPIGGMLDLSPLVAFFVLGIAERLIIFLLLKVFL